MSKLTARSGTTSSSVKINRPKFNDVWKAYEKVAYSMSSSPLGASEVYEIVGGNVYKLYLEDLQKPIEFRNYQNSCAIRLSYSFNNGKYIIKGGTINPSHGIYRVKGGDNKAYIMRVSEVKIYLETLWGKPEIEYTPEPCSNASECFKLHSKPFTGKQGVIAFDVEDWNDATGHVTLWDGEKCGDGGCFGGNHHYFDFSQVTKIRLWELK